MRPCLCAGVVLATLAFGVVTCISLVSSEAVSADPAVLPVYQGDMSFPTIREPSDSEEYFWKVHLSEEQELVPLDDQHVEVSYGNGHTAFGISATAAHDAVGSTVPTSIVVSASDVITLTVHHRAGNPAAGGASFAYPIIAGTGWEGGFSTYYVQMPPAEAEKVTEAQSDEGCLVPRLKDKTLKRARTQLREADCKVGTVRKRKGASAKTGRVVRQDPKPGTMLAPGTTVTLTLS